MKNLASFFVCCVLFLTCQTATAQSDWRNMPLNGNWKFSHVAVCEQGEVAKERLAQIFNNASALFSKQEATFAYSTDDGVKSYPLTYKWSNATKLLSFDFGMYENLSDNPQTLFLTQIYKARINAGEQLEIFFVVDNPQPDANTKPDYVLTFVKNK